MVDAEIVGEIEGGGCNSDNESDDGLEWKRSVNPQACEAFGTALEWLESQFDTDPLYLLLVERHSCPKTS